MAENRTDCPCSNIAIMQLFHELKQKYSAVPDQIISKIIQKNFHDKTACEAILERENGSFFTSYPRNIVSRQSDKNSCSDFADFAPLQCIHEFNQCNTRRDKAQSVETCQNKNTLLSFDVSKKVEREDVSDKPVSDSLHLKKSKRKSQFSFEIEDKSQSPIQCNFKEIPELANKKNENKCPSNSSINFFSSESTFCNCDSAKNVDGSHLCDNQKSSKYSKLETNKWNSEKVEVEEKSAINKCPNSDRQILPNNYQVAVQCSMQSYPSFEPNDQHRSFTTVNLSLRPPSAEPQAPIEITSGQDLTYMASMFNAKKGIQSQFQIAIGPGKSGLILECRTCISPPQTRYSCKPSYNRPQITAISSCCKGHHLTELLEKQLEQKSRLSRELRKEQDKLFHLKNEVKQMKACLIQKPNLQILLKLRGEVDRLREECKKLTTAVDLYSDTQIILPLGETDEEFYRHIYTGQALQREENWSCQLCTFRNHPLLNVCEECEMPRISLGTEIVDMPPDMPFFSNKNSSICTEEGISTSTSLMTYPLQVMDSTALMMPPTQKVAKRLEKGL